MIYLDHNSTTPIYPEVAQVVSRSLNNNWGNPSNSYSIARKARKSIEVAREQVARLCGATPDQVIFTSGATEANNAVLHSSLIKISARVPKHLVTSEIEHSSVLSSCAYMEKYHKVLISYLKVNDAGRISTPPLLKALSNAPQLVSIMWANNETGVITPISEISSICHNAGIPFHTDAVQAVGKIPVNFENSGADFMSMSGHKIGAPKGIGALIVKNPDIFTPFIHGGKQEHGLRGGTENVPYIAALGLAAEIKYTEGLDNMKQVAKLRDEFEAKLCARIPSAVINGQGAERIPNTSNIHIPGVDGDAAVIYLDQKGICISSGSACLEQAITPSHVILAMSGSHEVASESIRVSLGESTTEEELNTLIDELKVITSIIA